MPHYIPAHIVDNYYSLIGIRKFSFQPKSKWQISHNILNIDLLVLSDAILLYWKKIQKIILAQFSRKFLPIVNGQIDM